MSDETQEPDEGDPRERPPRENIVRALFPAVEVREAKGKPATLFGHFAVFNQWAEISSAYEGKFLERIAPGAFKRTFERRNGLRVLFNHGKDPDIGDKPIASITDLREDEVGAYYEAELLEGLPPLVVSGLRAGEYGASFRFSINGRDGETWDDSPRASDHNPERLPERTIRSAHAYEFGPVTFPAYEAASAGVRSVSMTDDYVATRIASDPERLNHFIERLRDLDALPVVGLAVQLHSDDGTGERVAPVQPTSPTLSREEYLQWLLTSSTSTH
jgi:HK97 family phage prohead protease